MDRIRKYGVFALLAIGYYLVFTSKLSHIITYHGQHHLFLYTTDYLNQQLQSAGILSYLTDFLVQFFHHLYLGSGLLAGLMASVYLLCHDAVRKLFGWQDRIHLSILPSLLLFFYTMKADHSLMPVVATFVALCALHLVLWLFRRYLPLFPVGNLRPTAGKRSLFISFVVLLIYAGCAAWYFVENYDVDERRMLKAEQHARAKNWDKVLGYTYAYLNNGKMNQLITYFHHLAHYHRGDLLYRLFEYPQHLGVKALYIPWSTNKNETEHGHFLYEALGHINEAHRWEFEAMVAWGETAPHLLNLVRYNMAMHRPKVAQRFVNKLKQSLFYRKEALQLESMINKGEVTGLHHALGGVENTTEHFTNPVHLVQELKYLCDRDPKNKMAFEYLMSALLLSNDISGFVNNLHRIQHFDYPSLPPAFEEALLVHKLKVGEEAFSKTGFTVSQATETRFNRYFQLTQNNQLRALQQEFGRTYWFYLNHISPNGKGK